MFNFFFHPYTRWLRDRSQDDVPGFNIDEGEIAEGGEAPAGGFLSALETPRYPARPSARPADLLGLSVMPQDSLPGFRVRPQDEPIGFSLNENGVSPPAGAWPNAMRPKASIAGYPDIAQSLAIPPRVEEPAWPASSGTPDWLHELLTMPLPRISSVFDPQTGRRIVPYQPVISPVGPYRPSSIEGRSAEQWPFSNMTPGRPADTNTRAGAATAQNINPQSAAGQVTWNAPLQPYAQANGGRLQDPWAVGMTRQAAGALPAPPAKPFTDSNFILANAGDAGVQQVPQQGLLPQDKQTQQIPASPPGTRLAGTPPLPRIPEKPGMEMTEAERRPEQELSQFIEEYRRAAADMAQELASVLTNFGKRFYEDTLLKAGSDLSLLAERFVNEPIETTFSVLDSFPQTRVARVEGEFLAGLAAIFTTLAENAKRGLAFERAVIDALRAAGSTIEKTRSRSTLKGWVDQSRIS